MRLRKSVLCVFLSLLVICGCSLFLLPAASAAEYEDGVYTADVGMVGEGWHNSIVSPTTVYIEDGNIYIDIIFVRTSSPWHAPAYVSLTTAYGTYYDPAVSDTNYTCAFYHVHVSSLGEIPFSAVTEAMSMPYSVDYAIYIDPDSVPVKTSEDPAPAEDPEPAGDPVSAEDPEPSEDPEPAENEEPAPEKDPEPAPEKDPAPAEPEKSDTVPGKDEPEEDVEPVPTTGPDAAPAEDAAPAADSAVPEESASKLGTGAVIGIACAAVVVIAAAALLLKKKK
ncbi:MAG: hypothetical protein J5569_04640 [Oscillospiraceae bacterium]|nr:hypothetical protein [Oscillospiraceae bacterium]